MKPLVSVSLLALLALAPASAVLATGAQAETDLTVTVPAGEFRAFRVQLLEEAQVEFGGTYQGVTTVQPVLPILAAVERLDAGCEEQGCAAAIFNYDWNFGTRQLDLVADVDNALLTHHQGEYKVAGGGWFTTFPLQPGEYLLLAASAPAESGTATLRLKVLGAATVLASQAGDSFWARGYDLSEEKYDVFAASNRGLYARAWSYSGGDAAFHAHGRVFGFLDSHLGSPAHWEGPSPGEFGFIEDGLPGHYTAKFPAEEWMGPVCDPVFGCDSSFGDTREDPPFAIAADVRV